MNKKEAIESIKKISDDLLEVKFVSLESVIDIVSQINEPQKVVVPKFVAVWLESKKEYFSDSSAIYMYDKLTLDNNCGYYHDVWLWAIAHHHDFIKAWHDGYEVEKEPLYTVRIPNPNRLSFLHALYRNNDGKIIIIGASDNYEEKEEYQLTEAEIKEDFEWAWQWAKPVEDN